MSEVTNRPLWEEIKNKWHHGKKGGVPGEWNARKAQLAVQEYKKLGGTYKTQRPSRRNSLVRWTKQDWGYIDGKPGNRYLPKKIRMNLTPKEKRIENRRKKTATKQYVKYSSSIAKKIRELD